MAWRDDEATLDDVRRGIVEHQDAGEPFIVAELDDVVIGYSCWTRFRGGDLFNGYRFTVEHTLHVDGRFHGIGVGRTLLGALIDEARTRGIHVMVAAIDRDNGASIQFHRAMGFDEVGRMPEVGRKFDRWLDLILMQRVRS